ncbi:hypothetical protein HYPSUDRAFT_88200 [Hypholoma sublateritium FD-334 SS-4]|uniref:Uncharacterized protein n=1 Tax=Hypholoma sublateritium (strain FD-334 SS-4) TaxID=945553 RepID=A0A0D2L386_HYPSF|nr:hypothetical protein HYPSUDRAFT_88200 [Hypholoma sublateritium FD-334 SS-4]
MGGNAFGTILPAAAFPRIPPSIYRALKQDMLAKMSEFYNRVGVPREAPEKVDYGDLDLLVTDPKSVYGSFVPHEVIKQGIGAKYVNPMKGNRTSNYAVPIYHGQWTALPHGAEEQENRSVTEDGEIYYQIDVHVCLDMKEYDRLNFFNSYGDLGMIMGLISRNGGLTLGAKGLMLPDPPNPPQDLSESFDEITSFLGLSMKVFEEGFQTREQIYEWVTSSKFFDAGQFRSTGPGISKVKAQRTMYSEFVEWVATTKIVSQQISCMSREEWQAKIRDEALVYFNKKLEYEASSKLRLDRLRLKQSFSGSRVRDWTGLGEYWPGVKLIMDEVRHQVGGENGILDYIDKHGEEGLRLLTIQVRDDLGIQRAGQVEGPMPPNQSGDSDISQQSNIC